jgi:outer membrane protein assembly factor BamD (BamD/ComL family)
MPGCHWHNRANLVLTAALAAAGLVGIVGGSLAPATAVAAAAKKNQLSEKVLKPLKAAQDAITAKNWDEAMVHIQEAQAVEGRTAFDDYQINDFAWFVYYQKKQIPEASAALEQVVNSGFVAPEVMPQRLKAVMQLNLSSKNYAKAIEYGNKYLALNPGDQEAALQVAQATYLLKDYAGAKAAAEKLVAGSAKPNEDALKLLLRANMDLKNDPGAVQALESLVRYYPQPKYWKDVLTYQLFRTKDERGLRALYRLMSDTHTLEKGEDYSEMGSSLIAGGFPNEAKQVLERGMAANVFQGDSKARAQVDLDRARTQAAADAKDLPNADKALAVAKTGNEMVATGKLFFSSGDYAKAADAIQKGLAKGGVTDVEDANLLLGVAYARSGKSAEATAALSAVKDAKLAEVARLWKLKLESDAVAAATPAAPPAG